MIKTYDCLIREGIAGLLLTWLAAIGYSEPLKFDFDDPSSAGRWELKGGAAVDAAPQREGQALRIPPGGKASLKLRDEDGSGEVEMWVFDDGAAPADPKQRRASAHWGITDAEGRILAVGPFCAPYLSGDKTYSAAEYNPGKRQPPFQKIAYLGVQREPKWRKWTFHFDPDKGLSILVDGRDVNAQRQRYDWGKSEVGGFSGIVIVGDPTGEGAQTIFIDDITVNLGGPMNVRPSSATPEADAAPAQAVVPEQDEPLRGESARLRPEVAQVHPRLLFGSDDLPRLRANYAHETMKPFRVAFTSYLNASRKVPTQPGFLRDATDGQRQGLWRMPTVAYHYLMTGDAASLEAAREYLRMLLGLENWEAGAELDSGMSSANILAGAALVYDWIYDQLDPELREAVRKKLITMARRQYYGGHLMRNPGTHYWQNDPHNNHRWHRNAGLVLAAIAAYGGPADNWILTKALEEMRFVLQWLPEDGTSHESPTYLIFGGLHLQLAYEATVRCLDPSLKEVPFFKSVGPYWAQVVTPGLDRYFYFGDSAGEPGNGYVYFLYRNLARYRQADVQMLLDTLASQQPQAHCAWVALMWRDPELSGGSVEKLPRRALFPDLGIVLARDGWEASNAGLMFKCGPLGGFKLNDYRNRHNFRYINVAHDDPDANSFVLFKGGAFLAETSRYSRKKQSANHNTILVNGRGQAAAGRSDVSGWNQPASGQTDMTERIRLTAYKAVDGIVIAEGEAAGAYAPLRAGDGRPASPGLERFRRAVVWIEGRYILILDDVRPKQAADISWLIQAPKLDAVDASAGRYRLAHDQASSDLRLVSDRAIECEITDSPADHREKPLGWRQLRAHAKKTPAVRYAAVLTPWGGTPEIALSEAGPESWKIEVRAADGADQWTWTAVPFPDTPYRLEGLLANGRIVRISEEDKAPIK